MMKNWMKRSLALLMVLVMSLSIVSCGGQSATSGSQTGSAANSAVQDKAISLVDQAGRTVTLDHPAETLVSCYYITTYATIALGVSDRVIGLEKKADTRPIYQMAAPQLLEQEQVGTMKEFNVEAVAALEPELVLMPKKLAEYADTLTDLGIQVLVVNPESQEQMEEMLTLIAKACGVEDKAEQLIKYYDEQTEALSKLLKDEEAPRVYLGGNSSYLATAPGAMYQSDLIRLANGVNVAEDLEGDYWTEVSYETILAADPEVIILPSKADYTVDDVLADAQLQDVTAVKNGAVYQMPHSIEEWDSPIPSGILGVMWTASVLHGDVYPADQFKQDVADFYSNFYGFEVDQSLIK